MKQIFRPVSLILICFSVWITWVCASLLEFDSSGSLITHSYSVWGDWSAHFTFINALNERGFHWIGGDNPLFPGIPFQYPFLSHVLTYFFEKITFLDTIRATFYSSLLLVLILPFALFRVLRKLGLTPAGSLASTLAFLLIGGFQLWDTGLKSTEAATNQFDHASIFTQFILFEFFPQRAFLFGLVAFLGAANFALGAKRLSTRALWILGTALALTSLLHLHTWIATATFLLFLFCIPTLSKPGLRKPILIFGAGVAVLSAVLLGFLLLRDDASSTRLAWNIWAPGWAQNEHSGVKSAQEMNVIWFWLYNTAFYLPLAGFGMWLKRKEQKFYAIAGTGIFLFMVADLFSLQPYFYDNLKLFTYSFLFLAPFVGFALEEIAAFPKLPRKISQAIAIAVLGLQISAGASDLYAFQNGMQKTLFFSGDEFKLAEKFKSLRGSPEDIVIINPRHNHWVPCLTGNPVAMGYPGWLWTWGISYGAREKQIHSVLFGESNADALIKTLDIHYAVIQDNEKVSDHPVNQAYFDANFKRILHENGWSIYSLNERVMSPSTSVR